jgi:hypothetical protein
MVRYLEDHPTKVADNLLGGLGLTITRVFSTNWNAPPRMFTIFWVVKKINPYGWFIDIALQTLASYKLVYKFITPNK